MRTIFLVDPMLHPNGLALLENEYQVVRGWELEEQERSQALAHASGFVVSLSHSTPLGPLSADQMARARALEVIASPGANNLHIDFEAATKEGIAVVNCAMPGSGFVPVAEHCVGLMLAMARRIVEADRYSQQTRSWREESWWTGDEMPTTLEGKTLGLVGFGFIGRDLAHKCQTAFGMDVVGFDPGFNPLEAERQGVRLVSSLKEVLSTSDFVSLHVALLPSTTHMIGSAQLAWMKPRAVLINTARGPIVDHDALLESLRARRIGGAALDVTEPEPLPPGHPLFSLPNVIITPHIAGRSEDVLRRLAVDCAEDVISVLNGVQPYRMINPGVWDSPSLRVPRRKEEA